MGSVQFGNERKKLYSIYITTRFALVQRIWGINGLVCELFFVHAVFALVQRIWGINGLVCEVFFVHAFAEEPETRYAPSFWF